MDESLCVKEIVFKFYALLHKRNIFRTITFFGEIVRTPVLHLCDRNRTVAKYAFIHHHGNAEFIVILTLQSL